MHGIGRTNVYDFGFQGVLLLADFHRRLPAYRIPGRLPWRWMRDDSAFRNARTFSSNVQVIPPNEQDLLAPGESFEDQFSVPPGGFLRYVSGSSANEAGFRWQLLDGDTDQEISSGQMRNGVTSGESVAPLSTPGPFLVPVMQAWPNGANLIGRVTNLNLTAGSTTRIQLVLFFATPLGQVG